MASENDLKSLYTDELGDLWSANDQMQKIIGTLAEKVSDKAVKDLFETSVKGISEHTKTLRTLLDAHGGKKDHCRGMEGLVEEARKHALDTPLEPKLRDLEMLAQYQRMSHYGLAGFGTAAAYAATLGLKDDEQKLKSIVKSIYKGDEHSSQLAVSAERALKG